MSNYRQPTLITTLLIPPVVGVVGLALWILAADVPPPLLTIGLSILGVWLALSVIIVYRQHAILGQLLTIVPHRQRMILDQIADGVVVIDPNTWQLVEFNAPAYEDLRYTPEEFQHLHLTDIERNTDAASLARYMTAAANGADQTFETQHKTKDGALRHVQVTCREFVEHDRHLIQCVWHDITHRKITTERLAYQADLLQSVSDAIISTDLDFNIVTWNRAAEQLYGWRVDEVISKSVAEMTRTDYPDQDRETVVAEFLEHGHWEGEVIQYHRDGTQLDVYGRISLLVDEQNNPIGTVTVNHDISPLKRAEHALRESETRYRSIVHDALNSVVSGVLILDADFKVVWINQALERFFDLSRTDLLEKDIRDCLNEYIAQVFEHSDDFIARVTAAYQNNTYIEHFECHILPTNDREERWLEHISQPIQSGWYAGGRIEHYYDITRRKQAEQHLQANQDQLEQRVQERTTALEAANADLQHEITERAQLETRLQQHNRELTTLQRVFEIAFSAQSIKNAYHEIVQEISASTGYTTVAIELYNESRQVMEFRGMHLPPDFTGTSPKEIPVKDTLSGTVVRTGKPLVETHALERREYAHPTLRALQTQTFVCVPMLADDRVMGTLSLGHSEIREVDGHFVDWVGTLANYIASLLIRKQAWEREITLLEQVATGSSNITAHMLGIERLYQSTPEVFNELADRFTNLLKLALERSLFKVEHNVTEGLRLMAERLGFMRAGPRDVIELYSTALRHLTEHTSTAKAQAYTDEGRLLVLELMGYLVSYYRRFSSGYLPDQNHE